MVYNGKPLFNNLHINNLNINTDLFELIPKGNAITNILNNMDDFYGNNMMALYGDWGSGKTSLMHYIKNELDILPPKNIITSKKRFKTIIFEAWKYENDENLGLSLLEQIKDEIKNDSIIKKTIRDNIIESIETGLIFAKNFLYTSKSKLAIGGVEIAEFEVGAAMKNTVNELENKSMYAGIQKFELAFKKLDEFIVEYYENIIIFIDDLDRCEPEKVLNLLAAIKLFFTYSKKIVYFCGVDKSAVIKAINVKYNNVIKSDEYLEKIFDISFNMPKSNNTDKIIKNYFNDIKNRDESPLKEYSKGYYECINEFFKSIKFANPRHIKKVLNKLELLKMFKSETSDAIFPDIEDDNNILAIIFTLYLIILHEFNNELFEEVFNLEDKFNSYIEFMDIGSTQGSKGNQSIARKSNATQNLRDVIENIKDNYTRNEIKICRNTFNTIDCNTVDLLYLLLPKAKQSLHCKHCIDNDRDITIASLRKCISEFIYKDNDIVSNFCYYLLDINKYLISNSKNKEEVLNIANLVKVINIYL